MKFYTLLLMLLLTACTSPTASTILVTSTPRPAVARSATPRSVTAEDRGRVLFMTMQADAGFACATCHYTDSTTRLIGPGLVNLRERFETYEVTIDFETYLRESILNPDDFITPGNPLYPSGVMPQNYARILTEAQVNDLVAFLLNLHP
jgi:cytochrome c553